MQDKPGPFPPAACTTLCNVLAKAGYAPEFYDIDAKRPTAKELSEYFRAGQFDIVGISAVVSTGYRYTKDLADMIKNTSPKTKIILGGNMAAAYEVILRKCKIDVCVVGEGEKVLLNLVRHLERYGDLDPARKELSEIKGIAFLGPDNACKFTGLEELIPGDEVQEPDYELLDKFSGIGQYIFDPMTRYDFAYDERSRGPARRGKKAATIFTSKGCVNRCTFCHRWIKGYRVIPVEKVISAMKHLMDKYNVGFFCISDECFGESAQWLEEFIRLVKPLDVLFQVGGVRVSIIKNDPTVIMRLKEAGLTALYFGMESGSDKILRVMEKNANREENLSAARICAEAGVYTVIQLVIGMPGENDKTIAETTEFVKSVSDSLPYPSALSINYLQALPGTPCYELLRYHGFLGKTVEDEEEYLLKVSDINPDSRQYINVSEEPLSRVKLWYRKIMESNRIHWLKMHGWKRPPFTQSFRKRDLIMDRAIDLFGERFWEMLIFRNRLYLYGVRKAVLLTFGLADEEDRSLFKVGSGSLREILEEKKRIPHELKKS
ncbi:MAG: radical SAM protein [Candidatus Omnitrophota bacterium]